MDTYKIFGGNAISGSVDIQGSKNAVLPLMAASLLVNGTTVLHNYPDITDVYYMGDILSHLGCKVSFSEKTIEIDASDITFKPIPTDMIKSVRASVLFMGALVARNGYVEIDYPGGCMIGSRPVDYHIDVLNKLGVHIDEADNKIICKCNCLKGAEITLGFPSVGATENALIAASCAEGITVINNAAREPEIVELCRLLFEMGVSVSGAGSSRICIAGNKMMHETEHVVCCDRIVAGTYLCAGVISNGRVCCKMNNPQDMFSLTPYFRALGCDVRCGKDFYEVKSGRYIKSIKYIETKPYPGFPTDMQSQMMSVLSKACGTSTIIENMFESRFQIVPELIKMGAEIKLNNCSAVVKGKNKMFGASVVSKDLRGGAALIIAGIGAEGVTYIEDRGYIKRGYERIVSDINYLGGRICYD